MHKINQQLADMGVQPAPNAVDSRSLEYDKDDGQPRRRFTKIAGESKAARRMRRRGIFA